MYHIYCHHIFKDIKISKFIIATKIFSKVMRLGMCVC